MTADDPARPATDRERCPEGAGIFCPEGYWGVPALRRRWIDRDGAGHIGVRAPAASKAALVTNPHPELSPARLEAETNDLNTWLASQPERAGVKESRDSGSLCTRTYPPSGTPDDGAFETVRESDRCNPRPLP